MPGPFAISDRVFLNLKPEASYGVVPVAGNYYRLRFINESLKLAIKTVQSQEITGDRMIRDAPVVDKDSAGALGFEFQYGEHDFLIAASLANTWANYAGTNGSTGIITVTITLANTITASAGTPFTNLTPGQWFRMSGMVNAQNNNFFQVVTAAPTVITVAAAALVNEAATATAVIQAARIVNGTALTSFVCERNNADITQFEAFRGIAINTLDLSLKTGQIIQGSFGIMGKDALPMAGTTALPGTATASLTNPVMNAVSNVSNITEGGSALTSTILQTLDIKTNANIRGIKGISYLGPQGMNLGELDPQVSFTGYLADSGIYNKFINNTASSLSLRLTDTSGQGYVVTFPYGKYMDAQRPTGGKNQDVILSATFQALKDPTTGVQMIVDRCGAAVTPWA